ncbi:MAG: cell wall-active antibiotics response protein [Rikenellaceae bacterium]|jgi:hypothetical protein|nr:cell wall-active antibiotics response protein [Rikenellaceae bacterium]
MKKRESYRRSSRGAVWALLLIVAGLVALAFNLGATFAAYKPLLLSWQAALILIGLIGLVRKRRFNIGPRINFGSLFLIVAGLFLMIPKIGANGMTIFGWAPAADFTATFWPVLLVAAGLFFLLHWLLRPSYNSADIEYFRQLHRRRHELRHSHHDCGDSHGQWDRHGQWARRGATGDLDINSVFGSGRHTVLEEFFNGGEVNSVFGNVMLDLRKTRLKEEKTFLELNVVFGGVQIYLPREWNVELHTNPVAGGMADKRDNSPETIEQIDRSKTLVIICNLIFSGGDLLN